MAGNEYNKLKWCGETWYTFNNKKNVAIKKTVSTKRMIQEQLFSQPSAFFDKKIIAVIDATFAVAKRKPEKIQACTGFEPLTFAIPVCNEPQVYNELNQFNDPLPVGLLAQ